jgi:hypothetical protein
MLGINYAECRYAECHDAECRYAECRDAECCGADESSSISSLESSKHALSLQEC